MFLGEGEPDQLFIKIRNKKYKVWEMKQAKNKDKENWTKKKQKKNYKELQKKLQ